MKKFLQCFHFNQPAMKKAAGTRKESGR